MNNIYLICISVSLSNKNYNYCIVLFLLQRRLLREHAKSQADSLAVALWESTLSQRDAMAQKKRDDQKLKGYLALTDLRINETREARLKVLFAEDEAKYQEELLQRGLSYRKPTV